MGPQQVAVRALSILLVTSLDVSLEFRQLIRQVVLILKRTMRWNFTGSSSALLGFERDSKMY
jgi:hypothetical protein